MMNVRLEGAATLPVGGSKMFAVGARQIAVFNQAGELHAIDNRCPHHDAPLQRGKFERGIVTCPLHGWRFDVTTGQGVGRPGTAVEHYPAQIDGDDLLVELPEVESQLARDSDGVYRYLVRYGALGWVARFGSIEPIDCDYRDRVLVRTDRGLEVAEVLAVPGTDGLLPSEITPHKPTGEVLRRLTEGEWEQAAQSEELAEFFADCQDRLSDRQLPVEVIDCERLFDGETIVLYYLGEQTAELGALAVALGEGRRERVIFHPVIDSPAPTGCGSGGCGCHAS